MRIKQISAIVCSLVASIGVTSCLETESYEYSSDNTISAFALDTIYGVSYPFSIDQINGRIFNRDSLPFSADTIIDKTIIKTFTYSGWLVTGDSIFDYSVDTLDLRNTMRGTADTPPEYTGHPIVFNVYAPDGTGPKTYELEVRIHKTDPDSLVWGGNTQTPYTESFSGGQVSDQQELKTVAFDHNVWIYVSDNSNVIAYKKATENTAWTTDNTNLPVNTRLSSITNYNQALYAATADGKIFTTTNGTAWTEVVSNAQVEDLLTTFVDPDTSSDVSIAGIITDNAQSTFALAIINADGSLTWTKGDVVPDNFPHEGRSAIKSIKTSTGMQEIIAIGKPVDSEATTTATWFSLNGLQWARMTAITKYSLPFMNHPTIIYYGKKLYVLPEDCSAIYSSKDGMVWSKVKKKFLFPTDKSTGLPLFQERSPFSMAIDDDGYMWTAWGKSSSNSDEVWKARLNKLGFIIQ
jgi:hypothetical protein